MSKPKKHHYVQRAYLDRWSDTDGNIFICDLANGNIYKGPAKSAAWEKYYYAIEDPEHLEYKFEIEEFLGTDIEGPTVPIMDKLDEEKELTHQEQEQLSLYIAFQKTRVPFFQHSTDKLAERLTKESLIKTLQDEARYEKFLKDSEEKLKNMEHVPSREEMLATIEEGRLQMTFPRAHSLKYMLLLSIPLSDLYFQSEWTLMDGGQNVFITSDNPAVTISLAKKDGSIGVSETIFPISPRHCLLIDQNEQGKFAIVEESSEGVDEINRRILMHATRFLFGSSEDVLKRNYQEFVKLKPVIDSMGPMSSGDKKPVSLNEKLFIKRMRRGDE